MIVVTGANGQLGRAVVEQLLTLMPADAIVATVREPAKADDLAARGVTVRAGDFADPSGLPAAFAGAAQVLVVSVNKVGEEARRLHQAAIAAARGVGARVLYTSHMGARADSPFMPAAGHAAIESELAAAGAPFTALRHGFYAESALQLIGNWQAGEIRVPEDGPTSWTARADLAEADAAILAAPGEWDGITPPLTAAAAITMADIAAIASALTGRSVAHVVLPDVQWVTEKVAAGVPAAMAEMLLGSFRAARRGDFTATDATLGTLLGRAPRSFREVLAGVLAKASGEAH